MDGRQLNQLPPELIEQIFKHLNVSGMLNAQASCKQFYEHFSVWKGGSIPVRKKYLKENINRAQHLLSIAKKTELNVLLLGNRSMQANIISRPKYFFADTVLPTELDEDLVKMTQYKIRIFSSLHDGFSQELSIDEQIEKCHLLILCVSTQADYKTKLAILDKTLEKTKAQPILFFAKPVKSLFDVEQVSEKVIELEADYKRDRVAQIVVERLGLLEKKRRQEIVASGIYRSHK